MAWRIEHERNICIGCGNCMSHCPKQWIMNPDGKADLKNSQKEGMLDVVIVNDLDANEVAADSCPVHCIHLFQIKN